MKKLTLLCALAMTLAIPSRGSAQTVTVSQHFYIDYAGDNNMPWGPPLLTFKAGEVVTMTAALHPGIPPNDQSFCDSSGLFPGLFVYIAYNNGYNPTVIFQGTAGQTIGFGPYTFEFPGTLYATVRCVTADLDINRQITSKWTAAQKAAARDWNHYFSGWAWAFGAAQIPCRFAGPISLHCAVLAGLFQAATGGTAWVMQGIANDPADFNYTVIAQPVPIQQSSALDCGDDPECNALMANYLQILSLQRAILATNDKWLGAYEANDSYWQDQQANALRSYQIQLAALASQNVTLTQAFQSAFISRMAAAGATPIVVSASDIDTTKSSVAAGWTFDQQNIFTAMGFTFNEMEAIRSYLLAQNTSTLGNSDFPEVVTSGTGFYTMEQQFITAMGDGTQAIPTPSVAASVAPLTLKQNNKKNFTVTLLGSASFNATQVATNTITFGKTGYESAPLSCANSDTNADGRLDRVCTFAGTAQQGFVIGNTVAFEHFTYNGTRFLVSVPLTVTR